MTQATEKSSGRTEPALKLNFLSHGTLESKDLERTRKFYEEFFGFEVMQTSPISLLIRLGGDHTYAIVLGQNKAEMTFLNHNGIDVESEEAVNRCHEIAREQSEKWGLHKMSSPRIQHGTYSFYFWDADDNCWEILSNPEGGYSWLFEEGDRAGKGHMDQAFDRPKSTRT